MAEKENIQIFEVNLEAVQQPNTYDAELNVELPQNVEASMQLEIPEINVTEYNIKSISENGVELPIDENGNVDVTVPTKVSELDNDSNFVSESNLSSVAFSGDYDDLQDKPDISDIATNVANGAVSAHNESETAHSDIRNAIGTVKEIAEGANIAIVFDDYSSLVTFFNTESDALKVGTNLYVKTVDVPDLWISAVESESLSYTYTTDADFLSYINGNGQIGYYKFSELETQKVDLSNYATLTDLGTKVSKAGDTMTGGLLLSTSGGNNWLGAYRGSGSSLYRDCIYFASSGAGIYFGYLNSTYTGTSGTGMQYTNTLGLVLRGTRAVYTGGNSNTEDRLQRYDEIYVTGIISDNKTWTADADGKYTYTISDPVSGPIPKSFITEWNTLAGLYGRQSLSRQFNEDTGYFELNGLSDITYEEAIVILAESSQLSMVQANYKNSRTNLGITMNSWSANRQWQNSNTEVIYLANTTMSISSATSTFITSCPHLKKIIYSRWDYVTGTLTLGSCPSLEDIELSSASRGPKGSLDFRQAPNITLTTMVNFVTGAQNTSAVTWRIAGNTWTACQNDTTEYTYSGQTYTGIIAYAAAKSITITNQ